MNWRELAKKIFPVEFEEFEKKMKAQGRRPDSVEYTSIEKDVLRRDLTINALFYDIQNKKVVD